MNDPARPIGRVEAPLVNPNEPESQIVELAVEPYSRVARGDHVCTVETSKATFAVESELDGWIGPLEVTLGERVTAGQVICEVFDRRPEPRPAAGPGDGAAERPPGLKLTRKAERLALQLGLDLAALPTNRFLTERDIEALGPRETAPAAELDPALAALVHDRAVLVFGAGGLAKSLVDLMHAAGALDPVAVVAARPGRPPPGGGAGGGGRGLLAARRAAGRRPAVNAVGAIGRIQDRVAIFEHLDGHGFELPALVDPAAYVAPSAELAAGAQVFAAAAVCSAARIGRGVIVNTGAIVSHDCAIGDYSHIAPGAILAGEVEVGEATLVGMGVTARVGLRIGSGAIVGNGCVLTEDVPDGTIVSAGSIWPHPH